VFDIVSLQKNSGFLLPLTQQMRGKKRRFLIFTYDLIVEYVRRVNPFSANAAGLKTSLKCLV